MKKAENALIICTDKRLIGRYERVLRDMEIDIDIEYVGNRFGANIEASLNYIDQFREQGKEIIITRGFMAQEIRKKLDFKVMEISVSSFDVLSAIYPYAGKDVRMAAIECRSFIDVIMPVANMLGIEVRPYVVEKFQDFYDFFRQAVNDGADVICGGAMGHYDDFFSSMDIEYATVDSSQTSIRDSLLNALEVYDLLDEEKKKREMIETIANISDVGIIAYDDSGTVTAVNQKAAEIWRIDRRRSAGRKIESLAPFITSPDLKKLLSSPTGIYEIGGKKILVDIVPMSIGERYLGSVMRMKTTDEIISDDSRVRSILAQKGLQAKYTIDDIKGSSPAIQRLKSWVKHYAITDSTVLITGESGTGKELFAQTVHNASMRKSKPFLAINCSAFSPTLLESELFGYVSGAFTGARREGKIGVFETAHTGTIFLDEIGDMDLTVQAKILRVLQEKEIMRVGDDKIISVDVRVIAATNKNLFEEVLKGNFREDLYYRLNVLNIDIPPLRERKEDMDELIEEALFDINEKLQCGITGIGDDVIQKMKEYDWHGNVREMNSFIEKMTALVRTGKITMDKVSGLFSEMDRQSRAYREFSGQTSDETPTLKEAEKELIEQALRKTGYNKTKAARLLGIDRVTLNRKLSRG